jgi:tRNA(Ile)-lysidine synthase
MEFQKQSFADKLDTSLFRSQDKLLIAVSGGVDSVVLLDMLAKDFNKKNKDLTSFLGIAHCNFGLRGQESEEDEAFVASLAHHYQIPFFYKKFETLAFAEKHKLSIQVAARKLRYTWFDEILQTHHFQYVATAHHLNDSIETVLYNLAKGTGIAGLHGILPKQGNIIRPLLTLSKQEITQYATDNQLVWREDSSNATDKYSRNLLRHQVVPILKQINPNLEDTFRDNLLRIREVEYIFQKEVEKFKEKILSKNINWGVENTYYLDIHAIKQEENNLVKLYEVLKIFGFNFKQSKLIINSLESDAGKEFISNTHSLVKDRNLLVIVPLHHQQVLPQLEQQIFEKSTDFQYSTEAHWVHLDYDKVGERFTVRLWQEGDTFSPLGMKGRRKNVSDFLNDLKLPLNLKRQVSVLVTTQGQIAWVIGYRLHDDFKVTAQTRRVLELKIRA